MCGKSAQPSCRQGTAGQGRGCIGTRPSEAQTTGRPMKQGLCRRPRACPLGQRLLMQLDPGQRLQAELIPTEKAEKMQGAPSGSRSRGLAAAPGARWARRSHGQLPPIPTLNTVQASIRGNTGTITLCPPRGPAQIHCTSQEGPGCMGPFPLPAGASPVHRWRNCPPPPPFHTHAPRPSTSPSGEHGPGDHLPGSPGREQSRQDLVQCFKCTHAFHGYL